MVFEPPFVSKVGVNISISEIDSKSYCIALMEEMIVRLDRMQKIIRGNKNFPSEGQEKQLEDR